MNEQERARHRKRLRRFHDPGDFHELTFSCYRRMPLLTNDDWRQRLSRHIRNACVAQDVDLVAFVYMPEHIHLLIYLRSNSPRIGRFLASFKSPFSAEIKSLLVRRGSRLIEKLTIRERPGKEVFRFWQEGAGYDRNIHSEDALKACIGYIHSNPVRRGLADHCVDWSWSSARYYLLDPPQQQFDELPNMHGLPTGAFERTDSR